MGVDVLLIAIGAFMLAIGSLDLAGAHLLPLPAARALAIVGGVLLTVGWALRL